MSEKEKFDELFEVWEKKLEKNKKDFHSVMDPLEAQKKEFLKHTNEFERYKNHFVKKVGDYEQQVNNLEQELKKIVDEEKREEKEKEPKKMLMKMAREEKKVDISAEAIDISGNIFERLSKFILSSTEGFDRLMGSSEKLLKKYRELTELSFWQWLKKKRLNSEIEKEDAVVKKERDAFEKSATEYFEFSQGQQKKEKKLQRRMYLLNYAKDDEEIYIDLFIELQEIREAVAPQKEGGELQEVKAMIGQMLKTQEEMSDGVKHLIKKSSFKQKILEGIVVGVFKKIFF